MSADHAPPPPPAGPRFILPPLGPALHWDHPALELLDWTDADTELAVYTAEGDKEDDAFLLTELLRGYVSSSERLVQELLAAIADIRAGRAECRTKDLAGEVVVTVRPDAAWVWYEHAYPGKQLRPFPLDGMEAVLRRWAEAIRRYDKGGG